MLNAKALSDLLSKNSDERLCKRWWLMTPNGTLIAHTQLTDMKDLRRKVATAALTWQDRQQGAEGESNGHGDPTVRSQRPLHTLIMETEASNLLVRRVQPDLLLALEGGVPPRKRTFEPRITAEGPEGESLNDGHQSDPAMGTSVSSKAGSSISSTAGGSVLGLHRRKLDAMAAAITLDFEQTGFKMPDESVNKYF